MLDVPDYATVVGVPAKIISRQKPSASTPSTEMDHQAYFLDYGAGI